MKTLLAFLILCLLQIGCRNEHNQRVLTRYANEELSDTTCYPVLINEGTRLVYQVGHMTPDKGLKLYLDTIPNPRARFHLDHALKPRLSPEKILIK